MRHGGSVNLSFFHLLHPRPPSQPFTPREASVCSLPLSSLWVPLFQSELIRKTRQHKSSAILRLTVSVLLLRWAVLHHSQVRNILSHCSLLLRSRAFNTCRCRFSFMVSKRKKWTDNLSIIISIVICIIISICCSVCFILCSIILFIILSTILSFYNSVCNACKPSNLKAFKTFFKTLKAFLKQTFKVCL